MKDEVDEQVSLMLRTLCSQAETVVRRPRSTVQPAQQMKNGAKALEVLTGLLHDSRSLIDEGLLGQGSMGEVRLARQVSLDRLVAVKALKENSAMDAAALLSEALLAGSLEHPGILPIYALSLSADGSPLVVMKHIEGITWLTAIKDEAQREQYAVGRTRLEAHLKVAIQLCNAVHFAHARQVIHRDLKPENVMLGRFGEVYLVDWGIATSPGPSTQLAGTPAYMAPEMVGNPGSILSPATDVYLLGAILYEVVSGRPPHACSTAVELFASVMRSSVEFPPAPRPSSRPSFAVRSRRTRPSAIRRRSSCGRRSRPSSSIRALASCSSNRSRERTSSKQRWSDPIPIRSRSLACSPSAASASARAWKDNDEAKRALEASTARMISFELSQGATKAAKALLAELSSPEATLVEAVAQAEKADLEKAKELERLHQLEVSVDPLTGSTIRMGLSIVLGVFWAVAPLLQRAYFGAVQTMDETLATVPVAAASLVVLLLVRRLTRHRPRALLNTQIFWFLLFAMVAQIVGLLFIRYALGGLGPYASVALLAYWAFVSGIFAASLLSEVWPSSVAYGAAVLLALWWPERRFEAVMLANAVMVVNMITILGLIQGQLKARGTNAKPP
jgi:serine/threonine-protein kinase